MEAILKKSEILDGLKNLPEEITLEELIEKFIFIEKVKIGLRSADSSEFTSHEEVKGLIKEW